MIEPFTITPEADGSYEVSRLLNGKKDTWGKYETAEMAERNCSFANRFIGAYPPVAA